MPPREEYLRSPTRSGGCNSRRGHRSNRNHNNMEALSPSSSASDSSSSSLSPQHQHQIRRLRRRPSMQRRRRTHNNTKSVSFADMIQLDDIHEVYHWTEYSPNEKASVWYNQSDYKQFKDDCKHSVDAYGMLSPMSKKSEDDNSTATTASLLDIYDEEDCCTRGIERMTKECSCNYYQRRLDVLKEVRWFKYSGRCSFEEQELMARQVSQLTSASVLEAQDRAKQDEEFAIEYLKDVVSAIMMEESIKRTSSSGHHKGQKKKTSNTAATPTSSPTRQHRGCSTSNLAVTTTPPQDEEGDGSTSTYYCALPVLSSSPASSTTKKKRSNSPNVKSKRMLRAHATKLFREESLMRLSFEGL